jgi:hypothetical protein
LAWIHHELLASPHGTVTVRHLIQAPLAVTPAAAARLLVTYAARTDATVGVTVVTVGALQQVYAVWRRWCHAPGDVVRALPPLPAPLIYMRSKEQEEQM